MEEKIKKPKKLIEVALPLDDLNKEAGREKSIRHGHPSTLHLWWARRPLAAARAIIFAQMVNDPGYERKLKRGVNKEKAHKEREKLFDIIRDLVIWENSNDESIIKRAREEIKKSWLETCELNKDHSRAKELFNPDNIPEFYDPFAGGGAIPLEAQRLGLKSFASDLNPVPVVINKAMIEIPIRFKNVRPINIEKDLINDYRGTEGLALDLITYGKWIRDKAEELVGKHYPKIKVTTQLSKDYPDLSKGDEVQPLAWIWVRTVRSPNPAFSSIYVPLASSFTLATKEGKETYVKPIIKGNTYSFKVFFGAGEEFKESKNGTKFGRANFRCIFSGVPITAKYIREEASAGRISTKLMAVVGEGSRGRVYVSPTLEDEEIAARLVPEWKPDVEFFKDALGFRVGGYGFTKWSDLFTPRQATTLSVFSKLISDVKFKIIEDSKGILPDDDKPFREGGQGPLAYAEAIMVYLSFALDRMLQQFSTLAVWSSNPAHELVVNMFSRQTLSMTWDFGEINPFCKSASWEKCLSFVAKTVGHLGALPIDSKEGVATQQDSQTQEISYNKVISTDPPYYDNIGYADLSDYFYVWMRSGRRQFKLPTGDTYNYPLA